MAINYPSSLDTTTQLPQPSASDFTNSPSHAGAHDNESAAIIAVETKLGTGSSTPSSTNLLVSTGTGTSAWSKLAPTGTIVGTSDSQTLTNKTLTSPTINAPTITNATITADTLSGFTTSNNGTVYGMSVTGGVLASVAILNSVNTAAIQSAAVDYTKVAAGFCVQQVSALFSAVATGTTTIPLDDTIPQITEGTEFMTCSITPKSATNILEIVAVVYASLSITSADLIGALFQDSTANALSAMENYVGANVSPAPMTIAYTMTAGTTSSTTFRVRLGGNSASTVTFNGASGARRFGSTMKSSIIIREYKA